MKFLPLLSALGFLATAVPAPAQLLVPSPDHEQTFSFGMEQHRAWAQRGADRHLALHIEFTNDPFVDRVNPRLYDDFTFDFPNIRLGPDGETFFYHPASGKPVAVARRQPDLLGVNEIHLLPGVDLLIYKPHGFLTIALLVDPSHSIVER